MLAHSITIVMNTNRECNMTTVNSSHLKTGMKILLQGEPCNILQIELVKPGKGQAFNRIKVRNLKTGRVNDITTKSGESIDLADVVESDMQLLYKDNESFTFMSEETYEQLSASYDVVGEAGQWIKEQDVCRLTTWNGNLIQVDAPNFVTLRVTACDPGVKGDTVSGATKPATVETGTQVKVPLFVDEGDLIKIDTRTGEYMGRDNS